MAHRIWGTCLELELRKFGRLTGRQKYDVLDVYKDKFQNVFALNYKVLFAEDITLTKCLQSLR